MEVRGIARAQCRACGAHTTVRVDDGELEGHCATCGSRDLTRLEGAPAVLAEPPAIDQETVRDVVSAVIIDDHPLVLEAIQRLLDTAEIRIIGVAGDGLNGLDLVRELEPDVAVVDLEIPRLSGLEVIQEIAGDRSATRVLVYTGSDAPDEIRAALNAGAAGAVVKRSPVKRLAEAILQVGNGQRYVDPLLDLPGTGTG